MSWFVICHVLQWLEAGWPVSRIGVLIEPHLVLHTGLESL